MADYLPLENDCLRYATAPIVRALVKQESSFNPYAIGVVGGVLDRQPRNKQEAIATALSLAAKGYNYSLGCRQVNQANLTKYGLTLETVFEPEKNALAGNAIFGECSNRAVAKLGGGISATKAALSCYYSGNFIRGQQKENNQPSYVEKVLAHLTPGELKDLGQPVMVAAKTERKAPKQGAAAGSQSDEVSKPAIKAGPPPAAWDVFQEF
jgi:type IV secretion system protein VirB1